MTIRDSAALLLSLGLAFAPLRVAAAPAAAGPAPASSTPAASGGTAAADEKAANLKRAEELFHNGERLYTEGSYESAILAFQESYELSKAPQLLYNIGNAYERFGDFANARRYLDQYRAFAPEKEREALSRRIQALDQRQQDKEKREREAQPVGPSTATQPSTSPPVTPVQDTPPPKKERVFGPAAIALTAGVAVGLGLGIGFGAKASSEKASALDGCMKTSDGALLCSSASQDLLDKRKTHALIADIGFAVAGVAAIGLVTVLVLKATRKNKSEQRAQLAPYANPRGAGVTLGLRF